MNEPHEAICPLCDKWKAFAATFVHVKLGPCPGCGKDQRGTRIVITPKELREAVSLFPVAEGEPMLPAGTWAELNASQRQDIYEMKDRMTRHLNAEVEAFSQWHPELKIDYRFQVEATRR
ncbi:MAG: hypothetical protein ACRDHZ_19955 [Ktedonobacteraceae bacterium]